MRIQVRARNLRLSQDVQEEAERRILYALDRFAHLVREVTVDLSDLNGPRGGEDTLGRVTCVLRRGGSLTAEHVSSEALASVAHAVSRVRQRLAKSVELQKGGMLRALGDERRLGASRARALRLRTAV
jgi:ribosome-associated translation inhibitor RaiA